MVLQEGVQCMLNEIQAEFLNAILSSEREAANNLIDTWAETRSYQEAVQSIVEPVLEKLGELWVIGKDISYAQAFVSAKIAEDIFLKSLNETTLASVPLSKGRIVIGNIEDDCHSIGRNLVSIFLRAAGWEVYDLGNDVLASEFVDKALEVDAKIVAASAMMYTTAMNIKKLRAEIDDRGLKGQLLLAVGGAVFNLRQELVAVVGADGYSRNAIEASAMMETLQLGSSFHGEESK